jgi:lipoate-protein ligase A
MSIFAGLEVYHDIDSRSAALNMAIDEALLEIATQPTIRFYRWDHPALSFGYFGRLSDVEKEKRDIVRRWTGGGIVLHGEDLTYSIIIPQSDPAFAESSMSIYEKTHAAIRAALAASGKSAKLAESAAPKVSESCFANAVRADVLWNDKKIAGAAQRRTRRGLLQQGSIQNIDLAPDFEKSLAGELSPNCIERTIEQAHVDRAQQIAEEKYATVSWLRRR